MEILVYTDISWQAGHCKKIISTSTVFRHFREKELDKQDWNTLYIHLLKQRIYLSLKNKKKSTKKYYYFIFTNRNSTEALSLWALDRSSSMIIKVHRLFFCSGKPTGIVGSSWPRGQARNSKLKKKFSIVISWLWQNQCYRLHTSQRNVEEPLLMIQRQVCFQSNVADVQARHSSEGSEREEEELVTQAEISKRWVKRKERADWKTRMAKNRSERAHKRKPWTNKSTEHRLLITVKRK